MNNGSPGAASLNLRGLGDQRTRVLADGKRMVSYDYNGVVDVNAIPTSLIKRVDVLTGGASVSYFDFTANFSVEESYTLRLGLQNAFDKKPPLVGSAGGGTAYNAASTFPSVYDVMGRTFFVGITAKY